MRVRHGRGATDPQFSSNRRAEHGRLLRSPHGDLPLGLLAPYLVECGHRHTRTDDSSFTSAPSIATTSTWNVSPAPVTVDSTARFASPSTIHTTNVTSAEPVAT